MSTFCKKNPHSADLVGRDRGKPNLLRGTGEGDIPLVVGGDFRFLPEVGGSPQWETLMLWILLTLHI